MARPKKKTEEIIAIASTVKEDNGVVTFYCNRGEYRFSLPEYERDEFGNVIKNTAGVPKKKYQVDVDGNNKSQLFVNYKFDRIPVRDPASGRTSAMQFLGVFIIRQDNDRREELIAYLMEAKKNSFNGIMTEDEYKNTLNPKAFAMEIENRELSTENDDLRKANIAMAKKLREIGINVEG
jgi:hypothetical protein